MELKKRIIKGNRIQEPLFDCERDEWIIIERDLVLEDTIDGWHYDPVTSQWTHVLITELEKPVW